MKQGNGSSKVLFLLLALGACTIGAAIAASASPSPAAAASTPQKLTLYSVATEEQFLSMSDDRARGKGDTPFGNFKDTTTPAAENSSDPQAGDISLFSFNLYSDSDLKTNVGTGVFTCQYNFDQNAFCDVSYQLGAGTVIGAGSFNFDAKRFTLVIKGGSGKYRSVKGNITALPAVGHAQRLNFAISP